MMMLAQVLLQVSTHYPDRIHCISAPNVGVGRKGRRIQLREESYLSSRRLFIVRPPVSLSCSCLSFRFAYLPNPLLLYPLPPLFYNSIVLNEAYYHNPLSTSSSASDCRVIIAPRIPATQRSMIQYVSGVTIPLTLLKSTKNVAQNLRLLFRL